jgi:hypothetical protein
MNTLFRFSYIVCPLTNPRFNRENIESNLSHQNLPLTRNDLLINAECWQNYVVGKIHQYYNCDSDDDIIRKNAEEVIIMNKNTYSKLYFQFF